MAPLADPGRMSGSGYCSRADIDGLWAQKTRLDELFDAGDGDVYRRARDELYPVARRGSHQQLGNRAGDKLAEVVEAVGGLDCALSGAPSENSFVDICGAPGAWSRVLFSLGESRGTRMRGFGFSLREGTNPLSCTWYPDLASRSDFQAVWGADGTGDVCNIQNIAHVVETVGREVSIVVADGGFGIAASPLGEHLENYQEIISGGILLAEVLVMLETLRAGGCFVCKLFDTFSHLTASLLFIAAATFEAAYVVKPRHSRVVNSERYLVGKQFRGTQAPGLGALRDAVRAACAAWPLPGADGPWAGLAPLSVVEPAAMMAEGPFLGSVRVMAGQLCRRQARALRAVVDRALELRAKRRRLADGRPSRAPALTPEAPTPSAEQPAGLVAKACASGDDERRQPARRSVAPCLLL